MIDPVAMNYALDKLEDANLILVNRDAWEILQAQIILVREMVAMAQEIAEEEDREAFVSARELADILEGEIRA